MEIAVVIIVTILVVLGFIVYTLKNLLFVATPNQVMILAGGTIQAFGPRDSVLKGLRAKVRPAVEARAEGIPGEAAA